MDRLAMDDIADEKHGAPGEPGADPLARCHIYNCPKEAEHTIHLPASTDERIPPASRRAATVNLCWPCYTNWLKHGNHDRLRADVDLVLTRPPADGMARLEHDVVTLPPDQQALGLVEAILEQTVGAELSRDELLMRLALIQNNAERLKLLLEAQPALLEALRDFANAHLLRDPIPGCKTPEGRAYLKACAAIEAAS